MDSHTPNKRPSLASLPGQQRWNVGLPTLSATLPVTSSIGHRRRPRAEASLQRGVLIICPCESRCEPRASHPLEIAGDDARRRVGPPRSALHMQTCPFARLVLTVARSPIRKPCWCCRIGDKRAVCERGPATRRGLRPKVRTAPPVASTKREGVRNRDDPVDVGARLRYTCRVRPAPRSAPADQRASLGTNSKVSAVAVRHLIRPSIWASVGRARDDVTTSCGNHRPPG
jgi:hypothetical protein